MKNQILKFMCISIVAALLFTSCKTQDSKQQETENIEQVLDTTNQEPADTTTNAPIEDKITDTVAKAKTAAIDKIIPLSVIVTNLESKTGTVVVGVYGTKNKFLDEKDQLKEYRFKPQNGKLSAKITDLPYGEFGMAIYQDVNGDGKIDKNLIGIPKEPYAFSNNYKPTIKAPSFDDCKFTYNAKLHTVNMTLLK